MNTYKPIATQPNDYKLGKPTRGTEKKLHELIVQWPGHDIEERKAMCINEGWKPEHRIPELCKDVRMEVSAIRTMMTRIGDDTEQLKEELESLCDRFSDEKKVEAITADQYWLEMARILFVSLPESIDPEDLDFTEIRRGYNDFFNG